MNGTSADMPVRGIVVPEHPRAPLENRTPLPAAPRVEEARS